MTRPLYNDNMLKKWMLAAALLGLAQGAEIQVLCSNGVGAVLRELQPQFEKSTGHKLAIQFSSTANLKQRIEGGEAFDVVFLTADTADELIKSGKLAGATRAELARSGIGVGFRKGAPKPDVRTAAAMKQSLMNAKSIAYTGNGASRPSIDKMLERMGLASQVKSKVRLTGAGQAPEIVAKGEAEMVITLISEILPVPGVELAGPLPEEFQNYVSFSAAAAAKGGNQQAVTALIKYMDGPAAVPAYKAQGMEPR